MYVERRPDGLRASFHEAPGFLHDALTGLLTDTQRRHLREPLPASASLLGLGLLVAGAAVVLFSWDVDGAWGFGRHDGQAWLGVMLMALPTLILAERTAWRWLAPSQLTLTVARGTVSVHRKGRPQIEAPLTSCDLRFEQNLLALVVNGRVHHWLTGCTQRELRELSNQFDAIKVAFGSPDDVPIELGGVVSASVAERHAKRRTTT
ncbi:MAG: hypothetical protein H6735_10400 [Alphaproteobacteria bacterium]|nr:hypothetical protein [Alphaproteobacteria bacterium]